MDNKVCEAFDLENPMEALEHIDYEIIEDYGDTAYGHPIHVWDAGKRILGKCKKCGGYLLIQASEYHGESRINYYTDYFPVSSPEEADFLNKQYDGFQIEFTSRIRYLLSDGGRASWSKEKPSF